MKHAPNGEHYRVPPEPSRWPAFVLAVAVHVLLLAFLAIGVNWHSDQPVAVEAEVWDMSVQTAAAPPLPAEVPEPAPEPEPEPPAVEPPPVERPVAPPAPDIRLEREKERKAEELKKQQEQQRQKELAEKKEREERERKERERAEAEKKKKEELKKKEEQRIAAEKKKAAERAAKAEEAKRAKLREAELARITGAIGTAGTAAKSTAPRSDSGYIAAITAKIKSTTSYGGSLNLPGNPKAVFRVEQLPTGEIISVRMIRSSGVPQFDDAVEKGIIKASPLPKKKDGTVERSLEVNFSMKDLD